MKRHIIFYFFSLISFYGYAQFTDDFSDGDFTSNPTWNSSDVSGNGVDFQVTAGELQSSGPSGTATLSITTSGMPSLSGNEVVWEFYVNYSQAPSGSNNVEIYLLSSISDLTGSPEGYFIRLGESGSDDGIDFYKTSSGTALISDPNPSVATSINASIRVTRSDAGSWLIEADPTGGTSYATIGSVTDTEFTIGDFFGFKVEHTSTRNEDFFFDNISVSASNNDITPPSISTVEVISASIVLVSFNENVETSSAETITNYLLDNGYGNPSSASKTGSNEVTLTFSTDLLEANYQITVNNVEDVNGNTTTNEVFDFDYFIPVVAEIRDVIITEILPDPSPVVGLPEAEFIELYNNSNETFDLANWTFSDATSTATLPSFVLNPDSYVILTSNANSSLFIGFGDVIGISSLPSLNNTGDQLTLKNELGALIDFVDYDDDFYQNEDKNDGGFTLELINPNNVCGGIENWIASENTQGGTPGGLNSVNNQNAGSEPPTIIQVLPTTSTTLTVVFSEPLDSTSFSQADIDLVGLVINQLNKNSNTEYTIELQNEMQSETVYTLSISNALDCTGNNFDQNSFEFQYIENPPLSFKGVIFTEIMANPNDETELPNAEYVEIFNRTNSTLVVNNWTFSDASSATTLPFSTIESNSYAILTSSQNADLFDPSIKIIALGSLPSLNNSGDALTLKDENDVILDSVNYASTWYRSSIKDDGGFSLEIIDLNDPCSDNLNWIATENEKGGTPGVQNSVFSSISDNSGPEIISAIGLSKDTVLVEFNEILDANSIQNSTIIISNGIEVVNTFTEDLVSVFVILNESTSLQSGVSYTIEFTNVTDCPGNIISGEFNSVQFSLIEDGLEEDLHLNEILFNPRTGGVDFVEIYNSSNKFVTLDGWKLTNGEIIDDVIEIGTIREIGSNSNFIAPNGYLAITTDNLELANQYPKSDPTNFFEISSLPSYPNEEGLVVLMNKDSLVVDFFNYSEEYHNKIFNEVDGVSLERVSISVPADAQENWFSASSSEDFATPGYINSSSRSEISSSPGEITISPKVVVPDGDGIDDFATISYSFDQPGYALTITILDVNGREIKSIAQNDFVNADGFYTWDGTNNNGSRVRVGYYIVYVEAFSASGNVQEFKEKVVIGTRF